MSVLLEGGPVTGPGMRKEVRPHLPVRPRGQGESRRPPGRARVVAGRGRRAVPDCAPRRLVPRWPWLAAIALTTGLIVTGLGVFAEGMSGRVPEQTATVTVGAGETLWDMAREYAPSADADDVVARIRQLNSLGDTAVVPGLPLTVPVDAEPLVAGR
ncbi:LysM peptidoglycan-binding domain-containing protein [Amycolatopsis pithecellobii]|nr:LysM peptidoglycan-binding domain-containing protein [Amycolatopsis pithecellobii]